MPTHENTSELTDAAFRKAACRLNRALYENGLAVASLGNASIYVPESDSVYIKPSGVEAKRLRPEMIVCVDREPETVRDSQYAPSVDLPHHLQLYRQMPGVRAIIHTHSNYATAFAACHRPIPACLTEIADQFGGDIPCAPYSSFEAIELAECILRHRTTAPAILLGNHGMFAWGESAKQALKSAVMVEHAAKTAWLALQLGNPLLLPKEEVARWHDRYTFRYGQKSPDESSCRTLPR